MLSALDGSPLMLRDLHSHARQVAIDFLQSRPDSETPFWSIRDISKKYNYSEYAAYNILKILGDHGYLEQAPQRRAFLKRHVDLSVLGNAVGPLRPAFIWPYWFSESPGNFIADYAQEIGNICKRKHFPYLFLENPSAWGDPALALRLKAISANALLAVSPPASALILFTKLHADNVPVVALGSIRQGYDELGVVTIDGDKGDATRILMLKLKSLGVRRPLMVGYGDSVFCHAERVSGLSSAYPEVGDVEAAGFFTNVGDSYSHIREIKARLSDEGRRPDAFIFSDSLCLELAVESIPQLAEGARAKRFHVAAFDDTGLHRRLDFPVISLTLPTKALAMRSLELLQNLRDGVKCPKRTLIRRTIVWPKKMGSIKRGEA